MSHVIFVNHFDKTKEMIEPVKLKNLCIGTRDYNALIHTKINVSHQCLANIVVLNFTNNEIILTILYNFFDFSKVW